MPKSPDTVTYEGCFLCTMHHRSECLHGVFSCFSRFVLATVPWDHRMMYHNPWKPYYLLMAAMVSYISSSISSHIYTIPQQAIFHVPVLHKTNTTVLYFLSTANRAKWHLSSIISDKMSSFGHVIYSSVGLNCRTKWVGKTMLSIVNSVVIKLKS